MMKNYAYLFLLFVSLLSTACNNDDDDTTPAAQTTALTATLNGMQEVPANNSTGTGTFSGTLNKTTREFTYRIEFQGLTANPTAGHFHQAVPGSNGPVVYPLGGLTSPITGKITLTEAEAAKLLAGEFYANLHTAAFTGGEIRGNIKVQ
ncbi:CHRD domain-containing protein [Hymenobacter koreensis]|uniref:CHRD domain-containing protein n=1 Tax=Hymenobacter koreensis TaxID=1084523 RepID=A0ABP8ITE3_9BACT